MGESGTEKAARESAPIEGAVPEAVPVSTVPSTEPMPKPADATVQMPRHPSEPPLRLAAPAPVASETPVEVVPVRRPSASGVPAAPPMPSGPPAPLGSFPTAAAPRPSAPPAPRPSGAPPASPPASALEAYELLARSARLADLVAITQRIVFEMARTRTTSGLGPAVNAAADDARVSRADADTPFGNALDVLASGGEAGAERALASALVAHAIAETPRSKRTDEDERLAGDVLWLATHTAFDATSLLDRALGEDAADLWAAMGTRIRRFDRGQPSAFGRAEALVGAAALAASESTAAQGQRAVLGAEVRDAVLRRVLGASEAPAVGVVRLEGEIVPAPRGPIATTLLALSGILFAVHGTRLVARLALAYRRPAEVSLSDSGIRVKTRTELLGRTLREREHVILRAGLVRVVREVRFPRAAFYAGLLALAIGSYVGVRAFADGVRSASPSLLLVGLVIVALGVAADFALGSLIPGTRGRVRMAFVPRSGPTVCVGDVDAVRADAALARSLKL